MTEVHSRNLPRRTARLTDLTQRADTPPSGSWHEPSRQLLQPLLSLTPELDHSVLCKSMEHATW